MKCPDIDRLIDAAKSSRGRDPEVEGHLQHCRRCKEQTLLIEQLLELAPNPVKEVPETLNRRVFDRIRVLREAERGSAPARMPLRQLVAFGVLGFLTAFLAIATSGSAGSSGPEVTIGFPSLLGIIAVVLQIRAGRLPNADFR
jgi:hypothetical protein